MSWRFTPPLVFLWMAATGCSLSHGRAGNALQKSLETTVTRADSVDHAVLRVDAPHLGFQEVWTTGPAQPGIPVTADTPFLSASVGKLFVATTLAHMAADNVLSLDDPVSQWVSADVLAGLPAWGGAAAFDVITVRMLLGHRSGLPDYFDSALHPPHDGALDVHAHITAHPEQAWSRADLLTYAADHWAPYAPPGESFLYSDLNYDLAGLVIEGATGAPWHASVRARVLNPLGMRHTWAHQHESRPADTPPMATVRSGAVVLSNTPALSIDDAGGGFATTTGDLVLLLRGLHSGNPVALDNLTLDWSENSLNKGIDYGLAVWRIRPGGMFFLLGGLSKLHGVSGSTGSFVYGLEDGTIVSGTFDQTDFAEGHVKFLLAEVLPVLARLDTP